MDDLDKQWVAAAIETELANIERLSSGSNPPKLTKPDSPITLCMLKIASVINGYNLNPNAYYNRILYALRCHPASRRPRNIEYQWKRLLNRAYPRRRTDKMR